MMTLVSGDEGMNLIGLILIAALSGLIVVVSLGLRSRESSGVVRLGRERMLDQEAHQQAAKGQS